MPVAAPAQILEIAQANLLKKANTSTVRTLLSAGYAGAFIALGFVFYTTSQVGANSLPYGISKVVGGVVFSTGLAMVVVTGADLFTSTSMTLIAGADGKLAWTRLLRHWGLVYFGNLLGALAVALTILLADVPDQAHGGWGATALAIASSKLSHTPLQAFFLGILCNFMVCCAVWLAFAGKRVSDKVMALTFPIALFVATGFEHSVANMFIIPLGLMLKAQGAGDIMAAAGNPDLTSLTVTAFLLRNLLPVTLGNVLGGGVFVGLGMYAWQRNQHH